MRVIEGKISGLYVVELDVYRDARGFFLESYNCEKYAAKGISNVFVQDNHSKSTKGTLRGLHAQTIDPQAKLVRVIRGEVFDVAVDIRPGSNAFGQWHGEILSENNFRQLYVPRGFLHGFYVLSDEAELEYKCDNPYNPTGEISVRWDDPDIGIEWPVSGPPVISEKDQNAMSIKALAEKISRPSSS